VRFTFIIYENQRRWVGLGWTTSLFAYERAAWTDEHNNSVPSRGQFELPEVEDGSCMRWRWVEGSRWRVDGVPDEAVRMNGEDGDGDGDGDGDNKTEEWDYDGPGGRMGWVYYDNRVHSQSLPVGGMEVMLTLGGSGRTAVEAKTAGVAGPGVGNGTETPSSSRPTWERMTPAWPLHIRAAKIRHRQPL
jgi:hypothetical protein